MRLIKFRAWDKQLGRYHKNITLFSSPFGVFDADDKSLITEQFTGLLDCNGKEIYEGDIIVHPDTYTEKVDVGIGMVPVAQTEENAIAEVVMEKGSFGINVTGESESLNKGFNPFFETEIEEIETISNIYENPELLA